MDQNLSTTDAPSSSDDFLAKLRKPNVKFPGEGFTLNLISDRRVIEICQKNETDGIAVRSLRHLLNHLVGNIGYNPVSTVLGILHEKAFLPDAVIFFKDLDIEIYHLSAIDELLQGDTRHYHGKCLFRVKGMGDAETDFPSFNMTETL